MRGKHGREKRGTGEEEEEEERSKTHPNELELDILIHLVHILRHPEQRRHNIHRSIPLPPELLQSRHRAFHIALHAVLNKRRNDYGVRLVADFEDLVGADKVETGEGRLEVIDCLAHVAF